MSREPDAQTSASELTYSEGWRVVTTVSTVCCTGGWGLSFGRDFARSLDSLT